MDQHEITREIPLLNADGELTEPGYAKKLLPVYRRADIKASPMRIKEWDYYLINNGRFALALTIDDNGYMGLDSISLLNFEEGWEITTSPMCFMPLGKRKLPETSKTGDTTAIGKNYSIYFKNDGSFSTGDAACGHTKTHGTGARPPARWTEFPSAGTSATASATPRPPARTCCFTTARRTSSVR